MMQAAPTTTAGRRSQADRSASADVRNPLLALASAPAVARLSDAERRGLRALLDEIRREARSIADRLWASRRVRAAAYWRACSVYAGHAARLAHHRSAPRRVRQPAQDCSPPPAPCGGLGGPIPVLALPPVRALRELSANTRATLRALLLDLRRSAAESSKASWAKSKSPMAAYWADVATVAGAAARALRDAPSAAQPACAVQADAGASSILSTDIGAGSLAWRPAGQPMNHAAANACEIREHLACA